MVLIPFALAAGLFIGLLRRGKLENLLGFAPAFWLAGIVGLAALLVGEYGSLDRTYAVGTFIAGGLILIFTLFKNTRFKGAITIGLGLALNMLAVVANGHVPVRYDALVNSGEVSPTRRIDSVSLTGLREMETAETRLSILGEVVPVEILNAAISFGDLIIAAGVGVFAMHLLLARRRRGIDVDELLGDERVYFPSPPVPTPPIEPELDLRVSPAAEPDIDLRPTEPKLIPAASDKAQVFRSGE